ncbi:MAG: alkyl sulfatase C-terminal domain-containing protein [Actinomycetota bacterium]
MLPQRGASGVDGSARRESRLLHEPRPEGVEPGAGERAIGCAERAAGCGGSEDLGLDDREVRHERVEVGEDPLGRRRIAGHDHCTGPDRLDRATLLALTDQVVTIAEAVGSGAVIVAGDVTAPERIFANLDTFMTNFPIVEP